MLKKPQSQYTLEVSVPSRGVKVSEQHDTAFNRGYLKFSSPLGEQGI